MKSNTEERHRNQTDTVIASKCFEALGKTFNFFFCEAKVQSAVQKPVASGMGTHKGLKKFCVQITPFCWVLVVLYV